MTKLAAPLILAAHAEVLPTLAGWGAAEGRPAVLVIEGAPLRRDDPREYLTLGYVPDADAATVAFEPVPNAQAQSREAGTIVSQLVSAQADVATARDRVGVLVGSWVGWLAGDRTLGGRVLPGSEVHVAVDLALVTTRSGATATAIVTITYTAVTYG